MFWLILSIVQRTQGDLEVPTVKLIRPSHSRRLTLETISAEMAGYFRCNGSGYAGTVMNP